MHFGKIVFIKSNRKYKTNRKRHGKKLISYPISEETGQGMSVAGRKHEELDI